MNILIVEDDLSVARFIEQAVREEGHSPVVLGDGKEALEASISGAFDLVLLDLMLPGIDGLSVCRELRANGVATPILVLTARDSVDDRIAGLDCGADDYLVKPFDLGELMARVRAVTRRGSARRRPLLAADVVLDPETQRVSRAGKAVWLSATEYRLLELLMSRAGSVVARKEILEEIWQYDFGGHDNVLDVYIRYLRTKLDGGRTRSLITTVRGVGYRLERDVP